MRTKTARELAEEMEMDTEDMLQLFETSVSGSPANKIMFCALFQSLCATSQSQLLKFCSDNNDTDAYNFYHSLI